GDPDMVDIPIPGNDDSMRSIEVIVRELAEAVTSGKTNRVAKAEGKDEGSQGAAPKQTRRRSSRSQFSADSKPTTDGASDISDSDVITSVAASGAEAPGTN
ncbi:MAG TPA: 30S ribosomal protein S2, partial [Phycisphaerales bacterium]|nr:30S ribosomal protein S2 [Phycisphaerales bacterium]